MPSRCHTHALALAAVSLSAVLLSGCVTNNTSDSIPDTPLPESETSQSPDGGSGASTSAQSVAAACSELQTELDESTPELEESLSQIEGDPGEALRALQSFSADFAETRDGIENPEVRQVADDAAVALEEMIDDLEVAVTDPASFDVNAFAEESVPVVQEQLAALGEVCAS